MTWIVAGLTSMLLAAGLWNVELHDGSRWQAAVQSLQGDSLELIVDGQPRAMPLSEVRALQQPAEQAGSVAAPLPIEVALVDGSVLRAAQVRLQSGEAQLETAAAEPLKLPGNQLLHVRLNAPRPQRDAEWSRLAAQVRETDELVVVRPTGALDVVQGIVRGVGDQTVQFEFNGQQVDLPRSRLEGLLLATLQRPEGPRPNFVVELASGDRWQLEQLQIDQQRFSGRSTAGVAVSGEVSELRRIEPQLGRFVSLSELTWLQQSSQPLLALHPLAADDLGWLYQPQKDRSFLYETLAVRTSTSGQSWREYDQGLALHSRTELTYRLGQKYRKFTALVGIDPRQPRPGTVRLQVLADQQVIYDQLIRGEDRAQQLNLDIGAAQRLQLIVDYGDGLDTGDQLNLCHARLWE